MRKGGAEIVFVTGAELSLFTAGFVPGDTSMDRLNALMTPGGGHGAAYPEMTWEPKVAFIALAENYRC